MDIDYSVNSAHIVGERIQTVSEHCRNTAELAREMLARFNMSSVGEFVGLIHDCGKCTQEFEEYIRNASAGNPCVQRGKIIHSFAGMRYVLEHFHTRFNNKIRDKRTGYDDISAELISVAVGSHHGLFDCFKGNGMCTYINRMDLQPEYDNKAIKGYLAQCASETELLRLFNVASNELVAVFNKLQELSPKDNEEMLFYLGQLERLIQSALIDADRQDTASFMQGPFETINPEHIDTWSKCIDNIECYLKAINKKSDISDARSFFSNQVYKFSGNMPGIYKLNIPTGGGKTLTGLRYAVHHAQKFGKKHVILASPLLTIIDQNAKVVRDAVKDDTLILEHHSDILCNLASDADELHSEELLFETWNKPIIITTLVQVLNVLFSDKTTSVRRYHVLADSVLVLDEVQSVPVKMLSIFNLALNFLSTVCGTTIVLCSATQPAFEKASHPLLNPTSILSDEDIAKHQEVFNRNKVTALGNMTLENIAEYVVGLKDKYRNVLAVCNKRAESEELFFALKEMGENCIHLSASMCKTHRHAVLEQMKELLTEDASFICVSTQVIEAGVDISFGAAVRLTAGIDNIVQTAGRCNRNGESIMDAPVSVITCKGENLRGLSDIEHAKNATLELIAEFDRNPQQFDGNLASEASVRYYYERLYASLKEHYQDYCVDNERILDLLSLNRFADGSPESENFTIRMAFKKAGELFEVFDSGGVDVVVPYGEGVGLIDYFNSEQNMNDLKHRKSMIDKAKAYTVTIYGDRLKGLLEKGAVYMSQDKTMYLAQSWCYDSEAGILNSIDRMEEKYACSTLIL